MIEKLHYVSQGATPEDHLSAIERACQAGVRWVQLRIKGETAETVEQTAVKARKICDSYHAKLIINDFPEIAKRAGADGVHLGQFDLPPAEARRLLGPDMIIGGTANTLEDIRRNADQGVDYVGLGPFRFTTTKKNLSPVLGLAGCRRIMDACRKASIQTPVVAIGGIRERDVEAILKAGVYGVAIASAISYSPQIDGTVRIIHEKIEDFKNLKVC